MVARPVPPHPGPHPGPLPKGEYVFSACFRSADLQSAVSQNCILRTSVQSWRARHFRRRAECNSAIQQIANLRYNLASALNRYEREMKFFASDSKTAYEAKSEAQRIAFAPIVFQACRVLRDTGILDLVQQSGAAGVTMVEVVSKIALPPYGVKVLMESGLGIGLFCLNDDRFTLTK